MAKEKYYIKPSNIPPRFPLMGTLFWWLFLDYIDAPGWAFGALGVFLLLVWVSFFHTLWTKEAKDVLEDS